MDIRSVDTVINFDIPRTPEDYVHRVGRCTRADFGGVAISLVTQKDLNWLAAIESHLGRRLDRCTKIGDQLFCTVMARDEWWTRLSFGTSWPGNYRARTPNAQSFLPHVFQQDLILRTNVFAHRLPDASRATLRESRLADLDSFLFLSSQL